jgi:hypothetical protein
LLLRFSSVVLAGLKKTPWISLRWQSAWIKTVHRIKRMPKRSVAVQITSWMEEKPTLIAVVTQRPEAAARVSGAPRDEAAIQTLIAQMGCFATHFFLYAGLNLRTNHVGTTESTWGRLM